MSVTDVVSQSLMSWLNAEADLNILLMFVTPGGAVSGTYVRLVAAGCSLV